MRKLRMTLIAALTASIALGQDKSPETAKPADNPKPAAEKPADKAVTAESAKSALDFTMKDIDGNDVSLAKYKGKAVMIVNVASKCGMTKQYEQLQQLHEKYANKGLAILAFPANNFGGQEPGTNEEIKSFCSTKYKVGFDLFAKVSVKGDDTCELYKFLTSESKNAKFAGEIPWNFTKFLLDREGNVVGRFKPQTRPDATEVIQAIESALDKKTDK